MDQIWIIFRQTDKYTYRQRHSYLMVSSRVQVQLDQQLGVERPLGVRLQLQQLLAVGQRLEDKKIRRYFNVYV